MGEVSGLGTVAEAFSRAYDNSRDIRSTRNRLTHALKTLKPNHERIVREINVSEHMRSAGTIDKKLTASLREEQLDLEENRRLVDMNESVLRVTSSESLKSAIDSTRSSKEMPGKLNESLFAYFTGVDLLVNPTSVHGCGRAQILTMEINNDTSMVDFKVLAPFEQELSEPHSVEPVFEGDEVPVEHRNMAYVERTGVVTEHRRFPRGESVFLDQVVDISVPNNEIYIVCNNSNLRGVKES